MQSLIPAMTLDASILPVDALRRRNASLPVSRLPTELLEIIFIITRYSSEPADLRWLTVTWVSHAWRSTALSHQYLWAILDLTSKNLPEEFLRRSKSSDLHLYAPWKDVELFHNCEKPLNLHILRLLATTNRIRSLNAGSQSLPANVVALRGAIGESIPFLRSITLDAPYPGLFRSPRDLLIFLSHVHNLEELHLLDVRYHPSDKPTAAVTLSSLKVFELSGHPAPCRFLVDHIILPRRCRRDFLCTGGGWGTLSIVTDAFDGLLRHVMASASGVSVHMRKNGIQIVADLPCSVSSLDASLGDAVAESGTSTLVLFPETPVLEQWGGLHYSGNAHTLSVDWARFVLPNDSSASKHLSGLADALRRARFLPHMRTLVLKGLDALCATTRWSYSTGPEDSTPDIRAVYFLTSLSEIARVLRKRIAQNGGAFQELVLVDSACVPEEIIRVWAEILGPVISRERPDPSASAFMGVSPGMKASLLSLAAR